MKKVGGLMGRPFFSADRNFNLQLINDKPSKVDTLIVATLLAFRLKTRRKRRVLYGGVRVKPGLEFREQLAPPPGIVGISLTL
jgi:hypothetical protein